MKRQKGGKRPGAGRYYSPWDRIRLAHRYAELKSEFIEGGASKREACARAFAVVHGERTHKGSPATTKRLPISGRHEDIFLAELDVKRHNREPLDDFELAVLRSFSRRWHRFSRRWRHLR